MPSEFEQTPLEAIPVPAPPRRGKRKHLDDAGIPRQAFRRLVQEIADDFKSDLRFQQEATDALKEAAETMLIDRFSRCSQLALLCKMDTVRDEHWRFVQKMIPCSGKS